MNCNISGLIHGNYSGLNSIRLFRQSIFLEKVIENCVFPESKRSLDSVQVNIKCKRLLDSNCPKMIPVIKTVRLPMSAVAEMMSDDTFLKVVYLTRDPRAIVHSRMSVWWKGYNQSEIVALARNDCAKMNTDHQTYIELSKLFSNRLLYVKFEHFVNHVNETIKDLVTFLDMKVTNLKVDFWSWVQEHTTAEQITYKYHSTSVDNTTNIVDRSVYYDQAHNDAYSLFRDMGIVAHAWKTGMDRRLQERLTDVCRQYLENLSTL